MPLKLQLEALQAELAAISSLLDEAKSFNDPVGIMQYEERTKELLSEIESLKETGTHLASMALYFGGKPVFGSRGVAADFAGKALDYFQDIVSKRFAKSEIGLLGERGRIPFRDATTLMVTGVSHGSFGFLLDQLSDQGEFFDTALKEMIAEVMTIIESAGSVEEIDFDDTVETLDPRTLLALKDFFVNLDSNSATVRLVDDKRDFSLDEEAVHRARNRVESTKIEEEDKVIEGILIGFLPEHKRFELEIPSGETIYGSATEEATKQFLDTIERGDPAIGKKCSLTVKERAVKPLNRLPRLVYRLLDLFILDQDD